MGCAYARLVHFIGVLQIGTTAGGQNVNLVTAVTAGRPKINYYNTLTKGGDMNGHQTDRDKAKELFALAAATRDRKAADWLRSWAFAYDRLAKKSAARDPSRLPATVA